MRVLVDPGGRQPVVLLEHEVLTAFDVAVPAGADAAGVRAALRAAGTLVAVDGDLGGAHVHVRERWLRESAHAQGAGQGWDTAFAGMLAFASSRGWTDADAGTVRAHVVVLPATGS